MRHGLGKRSPKLWTDKFVDLRPNCVPFRRLDSYVNTFICSITRGHPAWSWSVGVAWADAGTYRRPRWRSHAFTPKQYFVKPNEYFLAKMQSVNCWGKGEKKFNLSVAKSLPIFQLGRGWALGCKLGILHKCPSKRSPITVRIQQSPSRESYELLFH